jgi:Lrp/AsnC family leucine-responsive transcriptional regulator
LQKLTSLGYEIGNILKFVEFLAMTDIDEIDRKILRILQTDGKIGTQELAEKIGMSTSPCWRRVRKLEENGIIDGYVALLDAKQLGLNARAYVHVSLVDHTEDSIQRFDSFVAREDQIVECSSITGAEDYLLKVVAQDPEGLEQFIMRKILALGIVRNSTTHFVLRQKKYSTSLPLHS